MKPQTKTILLITGSVLIAAAITVGIILYFKNKNSQENPEDTTPSGNNNSSHAGTNTSGSGGGSNNGPDQPTDPNMVVPRFNSEKELSNPYSELKDRYLYPKRKEIGGWDYTNVRSSAEVNTDQAGWWDFSDNLLTTINAGTPIGKVIGTASGLFNGYSYTWFKVKLLKPVGFWGSTYEGFVRADTVTFKPYEK